MARLTPADLWRIVKDVDLDGIRRRALSPVRVLVASEDPDDAQALAAELDALGSGTRDVLRVAGLDALHTEATDLAAALLITREGRSSTPVAAASDRLTDLGVPVSIVSVGDDVVDALLAATPRETHVAMARQLPWLRPAVSTNLVDDTAKANATYAFTTALAESVPWLAAPIAVGDMIVLTKNQLVMCYQLLLAHGFDGGARRLIGEVIGVVGSGVLLRQAARQLVGMVPVIGIVPKVAVAYAGTVAIGRAMTAWASQGRPVTSQLVGRHFRESLARGTALARNLVARRRGSAPPAQLAPPLADEHGDGPTPA